MADTPNPTNVPPVTPAILTEEDIKRTKEADESVKSYTNSLVPYTNALFGAAGAGEKFTKALKDNETLFAAVTVAATGAKEAYMNLGNIKTDGLVTFSSSFSALSDMWKRSPIQPIADSIRHSVTNMFGAMGNNEGVMWALHAPVDALIRIGKGLAETADNGLRYQNAMIGITAASGNFNEILKQTGPNFEGINAISSRLNKVLVDQIGDLGMSTDAQQETLAKWQAQVMQMPGGLQALEGNTKTVAKGTNDLTAAIQYAKGAGLDEEAVLKTMGAQMTKFGMAGQEGFESSLKWIAHTTQISQLIQGAKWEDVQKSISNVTDTYKGYVFGAKDAAERTKQGTELTEGASKALREYSLRLYDAGVAPERAVELAGKLTASFKGMSDSQKALMSQMSGGPGGIQGIYEMEDLIRKGDFKTLGKKADAQLDKIFHGERLTEEDAHKSQTMAQKVRFQEQTLINLGYVSSKEDAWAFMEARNKGKTGEKVEEELKARGEIKGAQEVDQSIKAGQARIEQTAGPISNLAVTAKQMQVSAERILLTTAQNAMSITGADVGPTGSGAGRSVNFPERMRQERRVQEKEHRTDPTYLIDKLVEGFRHSVDDFKEIAHSLKSSVMPTSHQTMPQSLVTAYAASARSGGSSTAAAPMVTPTPHTAPATSAAPAVAQAATASAAAQSNTQSAAPAASTGGTASVPAAASLGTGISGPIPVTITSPFTVTVNFPGGQQVSGNAKIGGDNST
jgi:hypothetical protein